MSAFLKRNSDIHLRWNFEGRTRDTNDTKGKGKGEGGGEDKGKGEGEGLLL